jgi:hypothetical protein
VGHGFALLGIKGVEIRKIHAAKLVELPAVRGGVDMF